MGSRDRIIIGKLGAGGIRAARPGLLPYLPISPYPAYLYGRLSPHMFRYRVMHIGNILGYAVPQHSHPILLAKKQRYTSQVLNNEIYDP